MIKKAWNLFDTRQLSECEALCFNLISSSLHAAEANYILGSICYQRKQFEKAISNFQKAINENSSNADYYTALGFCYVKIKNYPSAIATLQKSYELNNAYRTLYHLGVACLNNGEYYKSITSLLLFLAAEPSSSKGLHFLAQAYLKKQDYQLALSNFEKAILLDNSNFELLYNYACSLWIANDKDESKKQFNQLLSLHPNQSLPAYKLGLLLYEDGDFELAINHLLLAHKIAPTDESVLVNLGKMQYDLKSPAQSITYLKKAIELNTDNTEATILLGNILQNEACHDEALHYFKTLLKIDSDNPFYILKIHSIFPVVAPNIESINGYRKNLYAILDSVQTTDARKMPYFMDMALEPLMYLNYQGQNDYSLKKKYGQYFSRCITPLGNHVTDIRKVGILVSKSHEGIFIKCMAGIINRLQLNRIELYIIYNPSQNDKILFENINNASVRFLPVPYNIFEAADEIIKTKINLIYYWECGTDSFNYFLPYLKPAPIQCTGWGCPVTSGNPRMDYYISNTLLENNNEGEYTEALYLMDSLPSYYERPKLTKNALTRDHFKLDGRATIYLCIQNLNKIHPDFDCAIYQILEADLTAVVVFIESKNRQISTQLKSRLSSNLGETFNRVIFIPFMEDQFEYRSLIANADVVLDSYYYVGANTSYEAFEQGKAIVTWPDTRNRGRYTYGLYQKMGVGDCIVYSKEEYVQKALQLGRDKLYRNQIETLITQNSFKIFNDMEAVSEFEKCLEQLAFGNQLH